MAAVAFAVLAYAVLATATVLARRWLDYLRTERVIKRRLKILARSEL